MTLLPEADRDRLPACIDRAEADLVPATEDEVDRAVLLLRALPGRDAQGATASAIEMIYQVGFEDVPGDLLAAGTNAAIKHCRFRPAPAEVRAFIADELAARVRRRDRLRAA